jgi:hypothetical protein
VLPAAAPRVPASSLNLHAAVMQDGRATQSGTGPQPEVPAWWCLPGGAGLAHFHVSIAHCHDTLAAIDALLLQVLLLLLLHRLYGK